LREVFVLQNYSSKYKPNLHCHFGGIPAFFGIHSGTSYHAASAKEMKGLQRADEVAMKALSGCAWDSAAQLQLGTVSTRDDRLPLVKANIGSTSIHAPLRTERHIFRPHAIFCVNIPRAGRGPRKFTQTKRNVRRADLGSNVCVWALIPCLILGVQEARKVRHNEFWSLHSMDAAWERNKGRVSGKKRRDFAR
jgi:hypothetical protein